MIIVYTGSGKGKTTAALGLALRAVGWRKKILIIQFLKKKETGEARLLNTKDLKLNTKIKLEQYGTKDFVDPKNLRPVDFKEAKKALESVKYSVLSIQYDLVILDEINVAVKFGLISKEEVLKLLRQKQADLDLVLTGRWAPQEFIDAADLVTEFKEIKHPFISRQSKGDLVAASEKRRVQKGEKAKKGIDY